MSKKLKEKQRLFARRLQAIRVDRGFTQNDVQLALDYAPNMLSHWERGARLPKIFSVYDLAKLYKCNIEDFLK